MTSQLATPWIRQFGNHSAWFVATVGQVIKQKNILKSPSSSHFRLQKITLRGTRTRNLWIRSPTRYPLRQQGLISVAGARFEISCSRIQLVWNKSFRLCSAWTGILKSWASSSGTIRENVYFQNLWSSFWSWLSSYCKRKTVHWLNEALKITVLD